MKVLFTNIPQMGGLKFPWIFCFVELKFVDGKSIDCLEIEIIVNWGVMGTRVIEIKLKMSRRRRFTKSQGIKGLAGSNN